MNPNGQVTSPPNHGELVVNVWPTYVGVGESTDGVTLAERVGHPDYQRGQIWWDTMPDGEIVGHARVQLPKGVFTHLLFCHAPTESVIGVQQLEHPVVFDRPGFFDVDPIRNQDYLPR